MWIDEWLDAGLSTRTSLAESLFRVVESHRRRCRLLSSRKVSATRLDDKYVVVTLEERL